MPLYDFECGVCGEITESIEEYGTDFIECRQCGKLAKKIITMSGVHLGNEDAQGWIRSVTEVVDKDNPAPHVQEFIKNPTRRNYKRWMKGEGLRPLEPGERHKPPNEDRSAIRQREMWRRHQQRKRIEIG